MKTHLIIAVSLLLAGSAWADTYRVHYSIRGSGRDITVQTESSAEARRVVMDMFPRGGYRRPLGESVKIPDLQRKLAQIRWKFSAYENVTARHGKARPRAGELPRDARSSIIGSETQRIVIYDFVPKS
jgi:hypothetical protein